MNILIDLDGTVRDTWSLYRHFAQLALRGTDWPESWAEAGPAQYWFLKGLEHPRLSQLEKIWERKGLFEHALPYHGAVRTIKQLANMGHHIMLVTHAYDTNYAWAENRQWVEDHFGPDWARYHLRQTPDRTDIQADLLIDDKPDISGNCSTPSWRQILFDQPYNRSVGKLRIYSWNLEEVLQLL